MFLGNITFKKTYFVNKPFAHLCTLLETKYNEFWKVTDDLNTGKFEVYKLDDALNIKTAVWGHNFVNLRQAMKFINQQPRGAYETTKTKRA